MQLSIASDARSRLPFESPLKRSDAIYFVLFMAPYLAMLWFFAVTDVYHHHFFDAGYSPLYNFFRVAFVFYFFLGLSATGALVLTAIDRHALRTLPVAAQLALGFFAGVALWHLLMLALGYLSLYTRANAIVLFTPFVALSYMIARQVLRHVATRISAARTEQSVAHRLLYGSAIVVLALAAAALLLVKGLYPAGGHDYWTHYFYYLVTVVKNHSIWPNEVWYHYYYMKGVGSYFLGILLTDPLTPSLVVYCFVAGGAIALFQLVDGARPGTLWPWAAVVAYFFFYLLDLPAHYIAVAIDGWGEFAKPHELDAAFLVAIVWASTSIFREERELRPIFFTTIALCSVAAAFVSQPTGFLIGAFFALLIVYAAVLRNWRIVATFFVLGAITATAVVSVLVINYVTTGVPLQDFVRIAWPIVDLHKLAKLGWLYDVLLINEDFFGFHFIPLTSPAMLGFLYDVFRVDILGPYVFYSGGLILLLLATAAFLLIGRFSVRCWTTFAVVMAFGAVVLIFTVSAGSTQPISFFRYSSFNLPMMAAAIAVTWLCLASLIDNRFIKATVTHGVPIAATVLAIGVFYQAHAKPLTTIVANAARFVTGSFSIENAYRNQQGWPGRLKYGVIYPGSLGVWKFLGPGVRIWSMDIHNYCLLPDCDMERATSFIMSPRMFDVMLGPADKAEAILRSEGLNYFVVSTDLQMRDWLPLSALFSPDHIADHLGVKWTDGTTYLLTWRGPGVAPLTAEWLRLYREKVNQSPLIVRWRSVHLLDDLRKIDKQLKRTPPPRWGRDITLPWAKPSGS